MFLRQVFFIAKTCVLCAVGFASAAEVSYSFSGLVVGHGVTVIPPDSSGARPSGIESAALPGLFVGDAFTIQFSIDSQALVQDQSDPNIASVAGTFSLEGAPVSGQIGSYSFSTSFQGNALLAQAALRNPAVVNESVVGATTAFGFAGLNMSRNTFESTVLSANVLDVAEMSLDTLFIDGGVREGLLPVFDPNDFFGARPNEAYGNVFNRNNIILEVFGLNSNGTRVFEQIFLEIEAGSGVIGSEVPLPASLPFMVAGILGLANLGRQRKSN